MKKEINMMHIPERGADKKAGKNEKNKSESNTIITDPNGSYTGVPVDNALEKPVQDVDDL